MPLSEQEQRLLDEMERNLYRNDADFVAAVGGGVAGRTTDPSYSACCSPSRASGGLIAGVALQLLIVGVLGFALMFAGVIIAITPAKGSAARRPTAPSGKPTRTSNAGFMDRLNERWDRRQDGDR